MCKVHFEECLRIRCLLQEPVQSALPTEDGGGMNSPKLDDPTFNGNLINRQMFWEQFCIFVHHRSKLTDAEKLVHVKHALKYGTARQVIEGLLGSGESCKQAIDCQQTRYD